MFEIFLTSSHYWFHVFDVQLYFVCAQVCDPLINCVWHVNFGWLSTNNPTWLQHVSSNICNFFDIFHYPFHVFDVQLCFVGAQVCDTLISCVWHVTFGWLWTNNPTCLQDVSSNICIFLASSHYWFYVFDVQLCFVGAQRGEMLIFIFLILTFWFWTDFGLRCVGTLYASVGENIQKKCHFCLHAHAYTTPLLFRVPQRGEMLISVFLILTLWFWLDFDVRYVGTIYASVGEKIKKEMSLLSVLTCVHDPMSLLRTSGMRPTDWLCLACEFRVAINEQSGMTTGRKFQYLHWFGLLSLPFVWLWCAIILLSALSAAKSWCSFSWY